jgi:hypothetical protein
MMVKTFLTLAAAAGAAVSLASAALAADPVPFPSATTSPVFIAANTVSTSGAASNYFAPGSTVVFRAYAVDRKTKKVLAAKDVKYFYVTIPGQPNVKLKYDPKAPGASPQAPWSGSWTVPSSFPAGVVGFKVLVKSTAKRLGLFVQMPVSSAQLTVAANPPAYPPGAPTAAASALPAKADVTAYVDTVNGTRPAAAKPRPAGCTQTNVFKRGEQFVVRSWGTDVASGEVLSNDNVDSATASIPGQPALKLTWGPHGSAGSQVFFWSAPWNIPTDYALGDATLKVTYTTDAGKTGTFEYAFTIIP